MCEGLRERGREGPLCEKPVSKLDPINGVAPVSATLSPVREAHSETTRATSTCNAAIYLYSPAKSHNSAAQIASPEIATSVFFFGRKLHVNPPRDVSFWRARISLGKEEEENEGRPRRQSNHSSKSARLVVKASGRGRRNGSSFPTRFRFKLILLCDPRL